MYSNLNYFLTYVGRNMIGWCFQALLLDEKDEQTIQ